MRVFIPRFLGSIVYLVALTVVGAVGYIAIEGWPWHEALYMTVITITAVGFQEVRPLSELGRDFTMVLLAAGITGLAVWFALITSLILEFDLSDVRRRRWRLRTLIEARIPQETGLIVIAVRKEIDETREFVFNPAADTRLDIGDEMIVVGHPDQVAKLREFAQA